MSSALIIIVGATIIGLSIFFHFGQKLRVIIGFFAGWALAGSDIGDFVARWTTKLAAWIARVAAGKTGQTVAGTTAAAEVAIGVGLTIALLVYFGVIKSKGGGSGMSGGHRGHGSGGGGAKGKVHPHLALSCSLALPMIWALVSAALKQVS